MKLKGLHLVLGVCLLIIVSAALLLCSIAPSLLQSRIIDFANAAGIRMSMQQFSPGLRSLHAERLNIFIPKIWSAFAFEDVNVKFAPLSLPALEGRSDWPANPALVFDAKGYGGSFAGIAGCAMPGCAQRIKLQASSIDLSQHQQIEALGIESGSADLSANLALGPAAEDAAGSASLKLDKLSSADAITLNGRLFGLPQDLPIPRIEGLAMTLQADLKQRVLTVQGTVSEPNLIGKISGSGTVQLDPALRITGAVLDLQTELVDQAANSFNTLRQLIPDAKQPPPSPELNTQKRWAIHVDTSKHPRFQLTPQA
ncbi:MAG: hypothetical protein K1X83_04745 [Oligoflexia bacterium]|nr:hypothetical protein [Oligoflexia bacterium]